MTTRTRAAGVLTAFTMTALLAACSSSGSNDSGASDVASLNESADGGTSREFGAAEDANKSGAG